MFVVIDCEILMNKPIPEQLDYYLNLMAFQDLREVETLSEKVLRARMRTAVVLAKMVKRGVDVFDVTGRAVTKSMEDYNAGRYYTLGRDENG